MGEEGAEGATLVLSMERTITTCTRRGNVLLQQQKEVAKVFGAAQAEEDGSSDQFSKQHDLLQPPPQSRNRRRQRLLAKCAAASTKHLVNTGLHSTVAGAVEEDNSQRRRMCEHFTCALNLIIN